MLFIGELVEPRLDEYEPQWLWQEDYRGPTGLAGAHWQELGEYPG